MEDPGRRWACALRPRLPAREPALLGGVALGTGASTSFLSSLPLPHRRGVLSPLTRRSLPERPRPQAASAAAAPPAAAWLAPNSLRVGGASGRDLALQRAGPAPSARPCAGVTPSVSSCSLLLCKERISQVSRCFSICEEREEACPSVCLIS